MSRTKKKSAKQVKDGDGVRLNLDSLEAPEAMVSASQYVLVRRELAWDCYFAQFDVDGQPPVPVARWIFPDDTLAPLLASVVQFRRDVSDWLTAQRIEGGTDIRVGRAFVSILGRAVNVFRVSRNGVDALLEGFYVSPRSVVMAKQGKQLEAVPVAAIQLPVTVLLGVFAALEMAMMQTPRAMIDPAEAIRQ